VQGQNILTVEGLAKDGVLHPVQQVFLEEKAFQCGYCTPGMMMSTVALLSEKPHPSDAEIVSYMDRHLCRCNHYIQILKAVRRAAAR
jgi:carbon-monoxide dehydrogenase small subunit